jgi:AcrR family transcriptional regulator
VATRDGKALLTREDWTRAALAAMADGGVDAVAVDRLAKRLGASRGSFYWHFADRADVVNAALELWATEHTTALLPALEAITDPVERLRALLREVYERPVDAVELTLSGAGDDPVVAPVFARVTRQRIDVLRRIFTDLGLPAEAAADRAWLTYAFYLGHHQLGKNPDIAALRPSRLDHVVAMLLGPAPAADPGRDAPPPYNAVR